MNEVNSELDTKGNRALEIAWKVNRTDWNQIDRDLMVKNCYLLASEVIRQSQEIKALKEENARWLAQHEGRVRAAEILDKVGERHDEIKALKECAREAREIMFTHVVCSPPCGYCAWVKKWKDVK